MCSMACPWILIFNFYILEPCGYLYVPSDQGLTVQSVCMGSGASWTLDPARPDSTNCHSQPLCPQWALSPFTRTFALSLLGDAISREVRWTARGSAELSCWSLGMEYVVHAQNLPSCLQVHFFSLLAFLSETNHVHISSTFLSKSAMLNICITTGPPDAARYTTLEVPCLDGINLLSVSPGAPNYSIYLFSQCPHSLCHSWGYGDTSPHSFLRPK